MERTRDPLNDEVLAERARQRAKWGDQRHPLVYPFLREWGWSTDDVAHAYSMPTAPDAKASCQLAARDGQCTWMHIFVEEVAEAVEKAALGDLDGLCRELVQVEAVCRQIRENIRDGHCGETTTPTPTPDQPSPEENPDNGQ